MPILHYEPEVLRAAVRYWQRIFRMLDWRVEVLFVSKDVFPDEETVADAESDGTHRQAVIRVAERREIKDGFLLDYRTTIAHEFVHVLMWDAPRPGKDCAPQWLFEQTVDIVGVGIAAMTPWESFRTDDETF